MTDPTDEEIRRVAAAISKCDPWTNGGAAKAAISEIGRQGFQLTKWNSTGDPPPDEMFEVVSENGTKEAHVILWRDTGTRQYWEHGYCLKYPKGEIWWPEFTTHWMKDLQPPRRGTG